MSKLMLKMLADMAGVSPEDIAENVESFRATALQGVELLAAINMRLARIEDKLGIQELSNEDAQEKTQTLLERQENE